jgi:hypothetical protein
MADLADVQQRWAVFANVHKRAILLHRRHHTILKVANLQVGGHPPKAGLAVAPLILGRHIVLQGRKATL